MMKFEELDARMRIYETTHDQCVLPGIHMVARLDGRGFTHLCREVYHFEAPYDPRFRDNMTATVEYLVAESGFQILYGYTQSDEISLLFHPEENVFSRKIRKYISILAGECSARFSLLLNGTTSFDCRISQLPLASDVVDYFRWRSEDAQRNALNAHCYWMLRKQGHAPQQAAHDLSGLSISAKNEFLFQNGINFNDLPNWQKRGIGIYWVEYEKTGWNPQNQAPVVTQRRKLKIDYDLPIKDDYDEFIKDLLEFNHRSGLAADIDDNA
jgi:tRNA(His) guanylyltransferase